MGRRTRLSFSTHREIAVLCLAAKEGLFEYIKFKGESPPVGHQTWFELACEGKIPGFPKRKKPTEEVEDDYEEGQITEGSKKKRRKLLSSLDTTWSAKLGITFHPTRLSLHILHSSLLEHPVPFPTRVL